MSVETRIVFPPVEWAEENDYEWFAYSFEFGRVGNFAFNKLLKLNSYQVRRDVVYKAVLIRLSQFYVFSLFLIHKHWLLHFLRHLVSVTDSAQNFE